ncbi:kinase-like domain, phloem protein 2-like protein [Tanacetum coccineum]
MKIKACERHNSFHIDSVGSKKGKSVSDDQDNKYLVPVAIFHYREKTLDGIIDPDLWRQMETGSLNILGETAYDCLNEEQSQRPNIDEIVTRHEKALELQLERENVVHFVAAAEVEGISSNHEKGSASYFTSKGVESISSKKTMSSLEYLSHSQLSFEDMQSATNNFAPENLIRENTVKWVYQGRMLHSGQLIDIVVREFFNFFQEDIRKFRMEKSILSSLNHTNLVSVIGFCNKNWNLLTVYKKEAHGSLNKYLCDKTLTWMQRLKICLGVANALSYIHYDVGLPRRHRLLLTRHIVKNVYLDSKYKKTGGVTHKSDIYSFGVVLLEVLCGRSAVLPNEELGEGLLSQLAKSHLDDMIYPHLREQMDPEAFKIFSDTAYWCIKEDRGDRPYIDQVVKRLEKAVELQWKHENPINSRPPIQLKVRK